MAPASSSAAARRAHDAGVFLGDVIDSDADTAPETYTLEYRAAVANVAGNQAGTTLVNAATVRFWNTLGQAQSCCQRW